MIRSLLSGRQQQRSIILSTNEGRNKLFQAATSTGIASTTEDEDLSSSSTTTTTTKTTRTTTITTTTSSNNKPHKRRQRYSGRYPKNFSEKYKEHRGDQETISKVLAKGMTPAGSHVPIMVNECLQYLGLPSSADDANELSDSDGNILRQQRPLLAIDCTLGYGGHSSYILKALSSRKNVIGGSSRLIGFDQDSLEIQKTDKRLRQAIQNNFMTTTSTTSDTIMSERSDNNDDHDSFHPEPDTSSSSFSLVEDKAAAPSATETVTLNNNSNNSSKVEFITVNQNFATLSNYLKERNELGQVDLLLADLGLSSMQIDDNTRGFTYKRSGPLDMRMNPSNNETTESAYELLQRLRIRQLKSILKNNSDEEYAGEIASGIFRTKRTQNFPNTTIELADLVRKIVKPLILRRHKQKKISQAQLKKELDSTIARVMQAIRIEVNGEFQVLEQLLEDLPQILAPGGRAVFLTFHSGEDRRVKKSFKRGFKNGIYSEWSRDVVRPSGAERRNNPRSSCCKLRWVIRSSEPFSVHDDNSKEEL